MRSSPSIDDQDNFAVNDGSGIEHLGHACQAGAHESDTVRIEIIVNPPRTLCRTPSGCGSCEGGMGGHHRHRLQATAFG